MSDIKILKEMIKQDSIVVLKEQKNKCEISYSVNLEEPEDNYSIIINEMPDHDNVIIIKPESFKPNKIFNSSKDECKLADFVIIAHTVRKKIILCIEMKGGNGGTISSIKKQLEGGRCFVIYCKEIGISFWNKQDFLSDYEFRFVSITNIKDIKLRKTKPIFDKDTDTASRTKLIHRRNGKSFKFPDLIYSHR